MREKKVGVAVVMDNRAGFLIVRNPRWNCDAFPMQDVEADREVLASTAIRALENDLGLRLPLAQARELGYVGKFGFSGGTGEETLYEYWAYEVEPGQVLNLPASAQPARWIAYSNLLTDPNISTSTKEIAKSFVENQEVALAVVTRLSATATEYLLLWNDNYGGFFFPAMRIKHELKPDAAARAVVRDDLGYRGEVTVESRGEVPDAHFSNRFGRDRSYRFHVCKVSLAHLDLNQPLNLLERRLQGRGLQWRWYTTEQLRNPPDPMSPTLVAVRATVVQLIPPVKRDQPIRRSEGAVALIRRDVAGQTEWLAQWNDKWKAFFFVGGHRLETETFRECVIRETAEELGLTPDAVFDVALQPVTVLDYVAFSRSAGEDTAYTMQLFDVGLAGADVMQTIGSNQRNRWLTETEIRRLETFDARRISVTMPVLLSKAGLFTW